MPKTTASLPIYSSGESWDQPSARGQVEPDPTDVLLAMLQDSYDEAEARRFNGGELPEGYAPPSKRPRHAVESERVQARHDRREHNQEAHALRQAEVNQLARIAREARRAANRAAFKARKR